MSSLLALVSVLAIVISGTTAGTTAGAAPPIDGRLVDARSGAPIAGAEITIVGRSGSVRTDALGRFHWPAAPALPIDVIAVLPDGRVAGPIRVTTLGTSETLTLTVDAAVSETVTVLGAAPTLDAAPGASTSLLTRSDLELRHVQTLSQAVDVVPGVSAISEGQAAVPAIRGLARGRTLILVDGARASTERRAGANASFLDPATVRTIEVARGPGSVAYGSDAFGGVIAARTRGPDFHAPVRVRFAGTVGAGRAGTRWRPRGLDGIRSGRRARRVPRARLRRLRGSRGHRHQLGLAGQWRARPLGAHDRYRSLVGRLAERLRPRSGPAPQRR